MDWVRFAADEWVRSVTGSGSGCEESACVCCNPDDDDVGFFSNGDVEVQDTRSMRQQGAAAAVCNRRQMADGEVEMVRQVRKGAQAQSSSSGELVGASVGQGDRLMRKW